MKRDIQISVIIPNYNYERFISECIHSVINSDFNKNNMEIIVVDDSSTDQSVEIISSFVSSENGLVKLIQNTQNMGLAKTRNIGINAAEGKYLFFLDSDNYIGKSCLSKHHNFLSQNSDYVACYAPIQKFNDSNKELTYVFSNEQYDFEKLKHGNYIDAMSMIKKDVFEELGGYDEEMPISGWEDYELWLRLGFNQKKVSIIGPEALTYYRVHRDSMISKFKTHDTLKLKTYLNQLYQLNINKVNVEFQKVIPVQLFYSNKVSPFSENLSQIKQVKLSAEPKTISFVLTNEIQGYNKFRIDIGNSPNIIKIIGIEFKKANNKETFYQWNNKFIQHKRDCFLLKENEILKHAILQIAYGNDPQFSFLIPKKLYKVLKSTIHIDITLSLIKESELNSINKKNKIFNLK